MRRISLAVLAVSIALTFVVFRTPNVEERYYTISVAYDPAYERVPAGRSTCVSPARCEAYGHASTLYYSIVDEEGLRKFGLDPANQPAHSKTEVEAIFSHAVHESNK